METEFETWRNLSPAFTWPTRPFYSALEQGFISFDGRQRTCIVLESFFEEIKCFLAARVGKGRNQQKVGEDAVEVIFR